MTWEKIIAEMNEKLKMPGMANHLLDAHPDPHRDAHHRLPHQVWASKYSARTWPPLNRTAVQDREGPDRHCPTPAASSPSAPPAATSWTSTSTAQAAARYGLTTGDVNDIVETAIGGKTISTTVEGRERYPINVRYARDFRADLESLRRVLVPLPGGGRGAHLLRGRSRVLTPARPSIRSENGQLVGFVFVDVTTDDIDGYVRAAAARLNEQINFRPAVTCNGPGSLNT